MHLLPSRGKKVGESDSGMGEESESQGKVLVSKKSPLMKVLSLEAD